MAHAAQLRFIERVRALFPDVFAGARVLEVGSLDINGSVRRFFTGCDYLGIDVGPGSGVDLVCQGQHFDAPDGSFDVVISTEALEHDPHWRATFANMLRLCRPGGLLLMTCGGPGRPEHGTTRVDAYVSPLTIGLGWDHYRNLRPADLRAAVGLRNWLAPFAIIVNWASCDLYCVGFRRGAPLPAHAAAKLLRLRLAYAAEFASSGTAVKNRALIALLGERHYRTPAVLVPAAWRKAYRRWISRRA